MRWSRHILPALPKPYHICGTRVLNAVFRGEPSQVKSAPLLELLCEAQLAIQGRSGAKATSAFEGHPAEEEVCSGSRLWDMVGVDLSHFATAAGLRYDGFVLHPLCFCCLMTAVEMGIACQIVIGLECSTLMISMVILDLK